MSKLTGHGGPGRNQGRRKGSKNKTADVRSYKEAVALELAIDKLALSKKRVLQETARIGFSNMLDFIRIGEDGLPYCDFSTMTRAQAAAIGELTVESHEIAKGVDVQGNETAVLQRKVKFKLAPKMPALDKLGQNLGLWKHILEVTGTIDHKVEVTDADRAKALAAFIAMTKATAKV